VVAVQTITIGITVEAGRLLMDTLVDIPDGIYQVVMVFGGWPVTNIHVINNAYTFFYEIGVSFRQ